MKIVPVIDLLNGNVVHAVKGNRSEYQPLESVLCTSYNPLNVADVFKKLGFMDLYIADLNAITGKGNEFDLIQKVSEQTKLNLMVDAGVSDLGTAEALFQRKVSKVVVGTETLPDLKFLSDALRRFGSQNVVVSLDLKHGKVLSRSEQLASVDALTLAVELQGMGVDELIVLDLARVGSGEGVDLTLLRKMLCTLMVRVDVGGGIRDIADLDALKEIGVSAALIATALHSGKISVDDLRRLEFLPK